MARELRTSARMSRGGTDADAGASAAGTKRGRGKASEEEVKTSPGKTTRKRVKLEEEEHVDEEKPTVAARPARGRPRKSSSDEQATTSESKADVKTQRRGKRPTTPVKDEGSDEEDSKTSPKKAKTLAERKLTTHRSSAGSTPFPRWPLPTLEEADRVAWLLGRAHGYTPQSEGGAGLPSFQPPAGEDKYGGCGDVKDVLDATVRTILSCNTSGKNSSAAHRALVQRFGRGNWGAILEAKQGEVEDAIRCGGLANNKSKSIHGLLRSTQDRFGTLSLQHLHGLPSNEALEVLLSFQGVGPKVASCVLAFCLGRPSLAVDTHVHRLAQRLGWVPQGASREATYYHLNARLKAEGEQAEAGASKDARKVKAEGLEQAGMNLGEALMYPLHVLLIQHGKRCPTCQAKGSGGGGGGGGAKKCPLKEAGLLGRKSIKLLPEDETGKDVKEEGGENVEVEAVKQEEGGAKRGGRRIKEEEGA